MAESPAPASKRRRLSVGETVAILALIVSALSFWDAHQDRKSAQAARSVQRQTGPAPVRLTLAATVQDGDLVISARPADAVIQRQTLLPPTNQGEPVTTVRGRISADWLGDYARRHGVGKSGEGQVPIAIVTEFLFNGIPMTDRAIYDVAYTLHDRLLAGDRVELAGLAAVRLNLSGDPREQLDALWKARQPKVAAKD